jgi:hypothetical protein
MDRRKANALEIYQDLSLSLGVAPVWATRMTGPCVSDSGVAYHTA